MIALGVGAVSRLVKKVPGIAWVIAFTSCFLVALWYGGVYHGAATARVAIHRTALVDTARRDSAAVVAARAHSDTIVHAGRVAVARADSGRRANAALRAHVLATIDSQPPAVVQLTQQVALDSTAMATLVAGQGALLAERPASDTMDAVRQRQAVVGVPPPAGSAWKKDLTIGVGIGTALVVVPKVVTLIVRLFH